MRLDLALIRLHPGLSRRQAREVIEKGQVSIGGKTVLEPGRALGPEAEVSWDPNRPARPRARSSLRLLYQDDSLLVVDKPPGLLAVPSSPEATEEDTALARVQDYVRHLRPRLPYVGVVHRLDRDTSGALAFALTPAARSALRALFRAHRVERRYEALVEGHPPAEEGKVDRPIHPGYEGRRRLAGRREPGLPALTRWRVVERFPQAALLEVQLETGRQHQVRVHLAHIGLPILGDPVYRHLPERGLAARQREERTRARARAPRQMLHARLLAFTHPLSGRPVRAASPRPDDFRRCLQALRRTIGRGNQS